MLAIQPLAGHTAARHSAAHTYSCIAMTPYFKFHMCRLHDFKPRKPSMLLWAISQLRTHTYTWTEMPNVQAA